ncbi:ribose-phosphate diphosphokinase [Thermococci archaeon]|nr:MAG: ribose-phosphate diphosphokinase [Thermococci archaeon]RLF94650.1 MAG: ribose-phosphate diphosphokinase [Thermococci archaeon]RLF96285.1 MAG: ribose-phosphate diphosphokinase [Thermococci archaeon]HHF09483.1 ribose-phosphate diphosphokinase [Methanomicrobia archaeon]
MYVTGISSKSIIEKLPYEKIDVEYRRFPDGEMYIRFEEKIKKIRELLIVQSLYPPQDVHLIQLFFMLDACKELNINVHLFIPYLAYARQDKRFKDYECISSKTVLNILNSFNLKSFYTIDVHEKKLLKHIKTESKNVTATSIIGRYLREEDLKDPVIISPDKGAIDIARRVAEILNCEYDYLEKKRISGDTVETRPKNIDTRGRDVVIVDDMISTGGTMARACEILKKEGTRKVLAGATHLLMVGGAEEKLKGAGIDKIFGTDSVPHKYSSISVAPLIEGELKIML